MGATLSVRGPIPPAAMRILSSARGIDEVVVHEGKGASAVEFKNRIRAPEARMIVERFSHAKIRPLVVTRESTAPAREILVQAGIDLVDAAGNVRIDRPGVVIQVESPLLRREPEDVSDKPLRGKSATIVQVLLLEPDREWKVVDLAELTSSTLSAVHSTLRYLERREVIRATGAGRTRRRRIASPSALLDLFAESLQDRGVESLPAYRFAQNEESLAAEIGQQLADAGIRHAVSGSAAAHRLAPFLSSLPIITIWISHMSPLVDAAQAGEAEPAQRGANILFMSASDDLPFAFPQTKNGLHLANDFRIYVDSLRDPRRGAAMAEHFRSEVIGF